MTLSALHFAFDEAYSALENIQAAGQDGDQVPELVEAYGALAKAASRALRIKIGIAARLLAENETAVLAREQMRHSRPAA